MAENRLQPHTNAAAAAAAAADMLCGVQLRRENKALLERMEEEKRWNIEKQSELLRLLKAEEEQCVELEGRISELEQTSLSRDQFGQMIRLLEESRRERDELSLSGIMGEEEQVITRQKLGVKRSHQTDVNITPSASVLPPATRIPSTPLPHSSVFTKDISQPPANSPITPVQNVATITAQSLMDGPEAVGTVLPHAGNENEQNNAHRPNKKARRAPLLETQRPQTRSVALPHEVIVPKSVAAPSRQKKIKVPIQGKKPMHVYYNDTNVFWLDVPDDTIEGEYNFVNSFLKGIRLKQDRVAVTNVLERRCETELVNNEIRLLCRWEQVIGALVELEMVRQT